MMPWTVTRLDPDSAAVALTGDTWPDAYRLAVWQIYCHGVSPLVALYLVAAGDGSGLIATLLSHQVHISYRPKP